MEEKAPESSSHSSPRALPIIELEGKRFYVDERSRELRSVDPPFGPTKFIQLSSHDMQALVYAIEHGCEDAIQALIDDLKEDGEL